MGQTTVIVAGGLAAAIAVGAGLVGYSGISGHAGSDVSAPLLTYQSELQTRCLSTMNRAVGEQPLLKIYLGSKIKAGCACIAQELLIGRNEKEAYLIANVLPAKLDFELARDMRRKEKRNALAAKQSRNEKKLLKQRLKRAQKKAENAFAHEMKRVLAKSGMGPKKALELLMKAEKRGKLCLRSSAVRS